MTKKTGWLILAVLIGGVILITAIQKQQSSAPHAPETKILSQSPSYPTKETHPSLSAGLVPAHYEAAPDIRNLAPTLPPARFSGKAREAYQAVKEAPQTIAQMPCYCHCDRSLGHKSLHSCFEDNHAANCATCIDEALLAYQRQKKGLSAAKIREQIIAQYSQ